MRLVSASVRQSSYCPTAASLRARERSRGQCACGGGISWNEEWCCTRRIYGKDGEPLGG